MRYFLFLILGVNNVQAESVEGLRQKMLFQTSNLEEFLLIKQKIFEIQKNEAQCLIQMEQKRMPVSCYWLIKNNINPVSGKRPDFDINGFDQLCSQISTNAKDDRKLSRIINNPFISEDCRGHISNQLKKLTYIKKMARYLP